MSELSKQLREGYTWRDGHDDLVEPIMDPNVIALCDEVETLEGLLRTVKPVLQRCHEQECATYVWTTNQCDGCEVADVLAMIGAKP